MIKSLAEVSAGRDNSITFLRLIAALAVIYGHSFAITRNPSGVEFVTSITGYAHSGGVAVDFFFILSGYLVSGSLLKNGAIHYVKSRVLRIFPALLVNVVVMAMIVGPLVSTYPASQYFADGQTWRYMFKLATATGTEWFLPGVFEANKDHAINGSIWSVIIEIRLYLVLLLLYWARVLQNRILFNFLSFCIMIGVATNAIDIPFLTHGSTDEHVVMFFLIGCLLWVNRELIPITPLNFLLALLLGGITVGTSRFGYAYTAILVTFFLAATFTPSFKWLNDHDYSYGIYLYGWPVQQVVAMTWPEEGAIFNAIVSMCIATILGVASWHFIEKPALGLREKLKFIRSRRSADSLEKIREE